MKNRVALVTGAGKGIGRDIALRLTDNAAAVVVHYHNNSEAAEAVASEIEEHGCKSAIFRADLTEESQASTLIRETEDKFGRIDILVNNIGPFLVKPWQELAAAEWRHILDANLLAPFFCMKAVLPGMRRRQWGRIVNIGYSRAEQLAAFPSITPYAAAKTGLLILTRTAAVTEAVSGITVNMVSPGLIEGGVLPPLKNLEKARLGRFTDVGEAVDFLASEKAHAITGTNIIVAGTWKM